MLTICNKYPAFVDFPRDPWYNKRMNSLSIKQLDDFFMRTYDDYVKICAIRGYQMPDMIVISEDGNVGRKDAEKMKLCYQPDREGLLAVFKEEYIDCDYSFSFRGASPFKRLKNAFDKYAFHKYFRELLQRKRLSAEQAFSRLTLSEDTQKKLLCGAYLPEKITVLSLILSCGLTAREAADLLSVCGMELSDGSVRDVVVKYLVENDVSNPAMQEECLKEYHIESLVLSFKEE